MKAHGLLYFACLWGNGMTSMRTESAQSRHGRGGGVSKAAPLQDTSHEKRLEGKPGVGNHGEGEPCMRDTAGLSFVLGSLGKTPKCR